MHESEILISNKVHILQYYHEIPTNYLDLQIFILFVNYHLSIIKVANPPNQHTIKVKLYNNSLAVCSTETQASRILGISVMSSNQSHTK